MSDRRDRLQLQLSGDLHPALDALSPGLAARLAAQFRLVEEAIDDDTGHRGTSEYKDQVDLEQNIVTDTIEATEDDQAVTFQQLKEWTTAKKLVEILSECAEFENTAEEDITVTVASSVTLTEFFAVSVSAPPVLSSGAGTIANKTLAWEFVLPFNCTVNKVIFNMTTAPVGNLFSIGLYNSAKSKVLDTGVQTFGTTGVKIITLSSPVVLASGLYFLAVAGNASITFISQFTNNEIHLFLDANANRQGQEAVASAGGALPASLTTLTNVANQAPLVLFQT